MFERIAELLEQARKLDDQRLELDRKSKELKNEVDSLSAEVITLLKANSIDNLNGARITIKQKAYISDWSALSGYIREHDAVDLLQKRLTESAVKLRWDDGIVVPGVGMIQEEKLQLR